ncbi:MAG: diguanylate phosphodiesterase [Firmicutes bacterium]|nr:diguanylate phosphodiesterase [Bacillota bacterium]
MNRKVLLIVFLLLVFIFSAITFTGAIYFEINSVMAGDRNLEYEVRVIRLEGGDWGYPSPYAHYPRGPGGYKMCLLFDSLLERAEDGLIPWLAEDYQIKNNGKEYLFSIRDDVKWHDGQALTVEDVKFTFDYAVEHPMVWSYITGDDIEKVELRGRNQVLITVKEPNAAFLYNLGRTRIIPKHIWQGIENPKEFTAEEAVFGSGPYRLTDYNKEHGTYRLEVFEDFWGPKQRVKAIEFVPVSESILAFEKGQIDLTDLSPDLLGRYQHNDEYKVVQKPAFWGYRLLFNMADYPVLSDKRVRQAINYALDKNDLIAKIERGAGVAGSAGVLPPDHVFYNNAVRQYTYKPEKAKELLHDAGCDKLTLNLKVSDRTVRLAELIREQLARVGIEIKIISSDRKTHDSRVKDMEYELAILGHGGWGGEADYLVDRFLSGGLSKGGLSPDTSGLKGYNNPELNSLLLKQKYEFNNERRKELFFTIQDLLAEDLPEIPLYYTSAYTVYRPDKYDGWMFMYDHHNLTHSKLSYLERE